jgi:hypothetical protein
VKTFFSLHESKALVNMQYLLEDGENLVMESQTLYILGSPEG